jgi:hypothetical protein
MLACLGTRDQDSAICAQLVSSVVTVRPPPARNAPRGRKQGDSAGTGADLEAGRDIGKLLSTTIRTGADRTFCYTRLRIEPFAMPAETRFSLDPLVTEAG